MNIDEKVVDKVLERVDTLAEKLGTTSEYLVQIYAQRVWAEATTPVIAFAVFCICMGLFFWSVRRYQKTKEEGLAAIFVPSIVIGLLSFTVFIMTMHNAVLAIASPEAYAVSEILRYIR